MQKNVTALHWTYFDTCIGATANFRKKKWLHTLFHSIIIAPLYGSPSRVSSAPGPAATRPGQTAPSPALRARPRRSRAPPRPTEGARRSSISASSRRGRRPRASPGRFPGRELPPARPARGPTAALRVGPPPAGVLLAETALIGRGRAPAAAACVEPPGPSSVDGDGRGRADRSVHPVDPRAVRAGGGAAALGVGDGARRRSSRGRSFPEFRISGSAPGAAPARGPCLGRRVRSRPPRPRSPDVPRAWVGAAAAVWGVWGGGGLTSTGRPPAGPAPGAARPKDARALSPATPCQGATSATATTTVPGASSAGASTAASVASPVSPELRPSRAPSESRHGRGSASGTSNFASPFPASPPRRLFPRRLVPRRLFPRGGPPAARTSARTRRISSTAAPCAVGARVTVARTLRNASPRFARRRQRRRGPARQRSPASSRPPRVGPWRRRPPPQRAGGRAHAARPFGPRAPRFAEAADRPEDTDRLVLGPQLHGRCPAGCRTSAPRASTASCPQHVGDGARRVGDGASAVETLRDEIRDARIGRDLRDLRRRAPSGSSAARERPRGRRAPPGRRRISNFPQIPGRRAPRLWRASPRAGGGSAPARRGSARGRGAAGRPSRPGCSPTRAAPGARTGRISNFARPRSRRRRAAAGRGTGRRATAARRRRRPPTGARRPRRRPRGRRRGRRPRQRRSLATTRGGGAVRPSASALRYCAASRSTSSVCAGRRSRSRSRSGRSRRAPPPIGGAGAPPRPSPGACEPRPPPGRRRRPGRARRRGRAPGAGGAPPSSGPRGPRRPGAGLEGARSLVPRRGRVVPRLKDAGENERLGPLAARRGGRVLARPPPASWAPEAAACAAPAANAAATASTGAPARRGRGLRRAGRELGGQHTELARCGRRGTCCGRRRFAGRASCGRGRGRRGRCRERRGRCRPSGPSGRAHASASATTRAPAAPARPRRRSAGRRARGVCAAARLERGLQQRPPRRHAAIPTALDEGARAAPRGDPTRRAAPDATTAGSFEPSACAQMSSADAAPRHLRPACAGSLSACGSTKRPGFGAGTRLGVSYDPSPERADSAGPSASPLPMC